MFVHPSQLGWFAAAAILLIVTLQFGGTKKNILRQLIELDLIEKVFPYAKWIAVNRWRNALNIAALGFLVFALSGPLIGRKLREIKTRGSNVFILIDCSDSMLAEDFKPTRMEKSKRLLAGLVEKMSGNKVGIIAFAGEPYVFCPLTFDMTAVRQFLRSVEPGMIPQPGTRIGSAVRLALSKFPEGRSSNAVILLTDGEDHHSDPRGAAEECQKMGAKIFAIGIGSPDGEPIPVRDAGGKVTGFRKNKKGEVVLSKLGESDLAEMALATDGSYFRASESEQEIDLLAQKISEMAKEPLLRKDATYENQYQWFLAIALILLIAEELLTLIPLTKFPVPALKKTFLTVSALLLALHIFSSKLNADDFRKNLKEGNALYKNEKYDEALQKYDEAIRQRPTDLRGDFNKGAAAYKLQDWDAATEEFQRSSAGKDSRLASKSFYNLGNSQFQKGQYAEAVRSYQRSLKLNPSDDDTKFNLGLALQTMKNPPKQKQKQKSQSGKQKQKGKGDQDQKQKEDREESAKRTLKSAASEQNDKPVFKPDAKKGKKQYEEDW